MIKFAVSTEGSPTLLTRTEFLADAKAAGFDGVERADTFWRLDTDPPAATMIWHDVFSADFRERYLAMLPSNRDGEHWIGNRSGKPVRVFWHLFDRLRGIDFGLCWTITASPESPAAVVPVLNSRIRAIRLDPDHPHAREYIRRLRGIGFDGWVILSRANASLDDFVAMKAVVMNWITPAAKPKGVKK